MDINSITAIEPEDALKGQFLSVLNNKQIMTVFQPIISLRNGSIYGYEALSRGPENTSMQSPNILFECAEKYGKLWELELLCRVTAIETVYNLNTKIRLFLNVNPQVIHDEKFKQGFTKEYLNYYNMDPENIIFEITERGSVNNIPDFIKTVDNYKKQFYKIAIDDAGAGYSGLNMISDIHPHFLKLDMNLIRDVDKDTTKQALIKSLTEFASLTNTQLIAEGIETNGELSKLIDIGVHFGQGFYMQKPNANILPLKDDIIFAIKDANSKKNHLLDRRSSDLFICNISTAQKSLNPKILISQVYELMENDHSLSGLCITDNDYLVGIITRSDLYRYLSGQYGYNLYAKKTIEKIMSTEFLQVDYHESIETVSKKAMGRNIKHLYDFIAVAQDGRYYGVVTVKDLLEKTLQVEVNNAKHINPLSELPGNVLIEKKLEDCLNITAECKVLYFDMNNFKAYNDVYGFENGDRFIKSFAQILKNNISEEQDFIGHIGGDDFVAIFYGDNIKELCEKIIGDFDRTIFEFYSKNDFDKGYITTKNRHGTEEDFPLLSISVVVVSNKDYKTIYTLTESMAKLKKTCKQKAGSNYVIS